MVSRKTVATLMRGAGLAGIPRRQTRKNPKVEVNSTDLVYRDFLRSQPNLLWVCDITEHPANGGAWRRGIVLPDQCFTLLIDHKAAQLRERERAADLWEDGGWMFAKFTGRPIDPRRDIAEWKALSRRGRSAGRLDCTTPGTPPRRFSVVGGAHPGLSLGPACPWLGDARPSASVDTLA